MDKHILLNALELACLLNFVEDAGRRVSYKELVEEAELSVKVPAVIGDKDTSREFIVAAKSLIGWTINNASNAKLNLVHFKKRLKGLPPIKSVDITVLEDMADDGRDYISEADACKDILSEHLIEKRFKDTIKKLTSRVAFANERIDVAEVAREFQETFSSFNQPKEFKGVKQINGVLSSINYSEIDEIGAKFKEAKLESSVEGILTPGYQGVRDMLGWHQGFRRGDFWMIAALQHNWKSGFTINLLKHFAIYNKPVVSDPKKKPLLLHVSSENAITDNLTLLYQSLKENETHEPINIAGIDEEEATAYVYEKTAVNGYEIQMLRINPSEFTYRSIEDLVHYYEGQGYEVHAMFFDYLNMISKRGCLSGAQGMDTRDLFRRVRNFMSEKKVLFMTPHQISTDAKYLLRQGIEDLVKELKGKSYWDSCKTVDQEVDGCIICHIEFYKGIPYFTMMLDKHRKAGAITEEAKKYCCYRMYPAGAVRDDINYEQSAALSKVGGDNMTSEQEWY